MGYKNREIEVKILLPVKGNLYEDCVKEIRRIFGGESDETVRSRSSDLYWKGRDAQSFVRLRRMSSVKDDRGVITYKSQDRGCNFDRIEIDAPTSYRQAHAFMMQAFGPALGEVEKRYDVFLMGERDEHDEADASVSVYQITGSPEIFVEIEARSKKKVEELVRKLATQGPWTGLVAVTTSLYAMFVQKRAMKTVKLSKLFPSIKAPEPSANRGNA